MKVAEVKALSNVELITEIFYMGVATANSKPIKKLETKLQRLCKECESRGFVEDGIGLYKSMCQ